MYSEEFKHKMIFDCTQTEFMLDRMMRRAITQLQIEITQLFDGEPFKLEWRNLNPNDTINVGGNLTLLTDNEELMAMTKLKYGDLERRI